MRRGICRGRWGRENNGGRKAGARGEEDTKQLGWSLSHSPSLPLSQSLSSVESSLSLISHLSPCPPCVAFAIVSFVWRERERKKEGDLYCWWCCFLVSPSSRGQKEDAHKSLLLAPFVFPSQVFVFLYFLYKIITLASCFRSSCSSPMPESECLTSPRVQTRMNDFSLVYLFFLSWRS